MQPVVTDLSVSAQTAYVQLIEAALNAANFRSVADLNGSFNAKTVRGRNYWYFQYFETQGQLRQLYVGPDNESVRALVARSREPSPVARLEPLAGAAAALGCGVIPRQQARVLRRLAEYGLFHAGGVLIGTHAYQAYGNLLGVRFADHNLTQDIDFAHEGKSFALALPGNLSVETGRAIESLEMGFLPMMDLSGKTGGAYVNPLEPEFRLDFLTPLHRGGTAPYVHPRLNVTLQPLAFLDYLLEDLSQAVVFSTEHIVLVNVPNPIRFAVHKLIVSAERQGTYRLKAAKDIAQAAHLFATLMKQQTDGIGAALEKAHRRGPGWAQRLSQGSAKLQAAFPEWCEAVGWSKLLPT